MREKTRCVDKKEKSNLHSLERWKKYTSRNFKENNILYVIVFVLYNFYCSPLLFLTPFRARSEWVIPYPSRVIITIVAVAVAGIYTRGGKRCSVG